MDQSTTEKHLLFAIAQNVKLINDENIDQIKSRAAICGKCQYAKLLDTKVVSNFTWCIYRCTGKNCRKTLDTKILIENESCPLDKW